MTDAQSTWLRRGLLALAWISALYGVVLVFDGHPSNDTPGWIFFLVPIALVIGERITRGDPDEEEAVEGSGGDDDSSPTPSA